jgi:hypothetical protein
MRDYEIHKVEKYYVTANSSEEAKEKVKEWDNSCAHDVVYECVWVGSEVASA